MSFENPLVNNQSPSLDRVFIRDLVLSCFIGIYDFEHEKAQRVRFNISMALYPLKEEMNDDYAHVVCYETITNEVRELVGTGHVNLVETLAEDVATICLQKERVQSVKVCIEKLDIIPDTTSVGVEIERAKKI